MDTTLRLTHRAAEASHDASLWLRLFHTRVRLADWDGAAQAALLASPTSDTAEALDPLTPDLDDFVVERRDLEVLPLGLRWTPEGGGVYGLVNTRQWDDRVGLQLQLHEVSLATGRARRLVRSEPEHRLCFGTSEPAMHPGGAYLAFAALDRQRRLMLFTADRASGELRAPVGRVRIDFEALALSGAGVLGAAGERGTRFFQLTPSGLPAGRRPLITLDGGGAVLADDGVALARHVKPRRWPFDRRVECRDAASDTVRARIPAEGHEQLACVGRRVVLAETHRVRLHGATGELLAEAKVPEGLFVWGPVPSPSGRLVAFAHAYLGHEPSIAVLDLRTGRSRTFPAPPPADDPRENPLQCRWSPSGRKLLAGSTGRSCVLLVAT